MKTLRAFLFVPLCLLAASLAFAADTTWKVTAWNLEWFPSGKPDFRDAKVEQARIAAAANVLRELDPDIILLQEIRDEEAMQALAKEIGRGHQVVVVSRFKQGDRVGQQQQAILAKFPAKAAYWKEWTTRQLVTPTRGYSFALFETKDGKRVATYSLHLKSNAMGRDVQDRAKQETLNRLQRELATQQLVEHFREIQNTPELKTNAAIVGGDFNTDPGQKRFADEGTIPNLRAAGFASPLEGLPLEERTTIPSKGRFPDTTFDWIFLRELKAIGKPTVTVSDVSDHRPVTVTVELR